MAPRTAGAQLHLFLASLDEAELRAFVDQLHDLVCDELALAAEPEHLYGHSYTEYLIGERPLEPVPAGVERLAAYKVRGRVRELALSLCDAFTPPRKRDNPAAICDTVIALARRANQVNVG